MWFSIITHRLAACKARPSAPPCLLRSIEATLELRRADLTERGVSAPLVIEHLDVIGQGRLGVGVALKALGFFALHRREPALHHRVVIAIAPAVHAARDSARSSGQPQRLSVRAICAFDDRAEATSTPPSRLNSIELPRPPCVLASP